MTDERITLAHGDGGLATHRLVADLFVLALSNPALEQGGDSALLELPAPARGRLAMTTDSFVVSPVFFPGGDLGHLAVCGTVNDLAVAGARPLWLTAGFILEEGFPVADLRRLVASMAKTAAEAQVQIVAGDTKVVGREQADGCFINTSGVGIVPPDRDLGPGRVAPGMSIIVSGGVGEHGVAVLSARAGLNFETPVVSDATPLGAFIATVLEAAPGVAVMRDPTRGGLATTVAEIAAQSGLDMLLEEEQIPVAPAVAGACDMLGLDPLYLACEGRVIVWVKSDQAHAVLTAMQSHGATGSVIGQVQATRGPGKAYLRTALGGTRRLDMLAGENLPRIC
ncbi:MAG TPA: hydrogenase expression/formation protein HypE [Symbiobacteriaceae bacterium]|nr:hydrogenase expression/formation protein HypE [Symbiobacteriaceae bacterium]